MRTIALVLLAAACGGGSKSTKAPEPAPAPAPVQERRVVKSPLPRPENAAPRPEARVEATPEAAKGPPMIGQKSDAPPPPLKPFAILDRLHDHEGQIAGMPGWALKRVEDKTVCGGTRIVVTKRKAKLSPEQAALAKVYALSFPANLDFDPDNKKTSQASLKTFNDFIEKLKKTGADAMTYFEGQLSTSDVAVKMASAARIAQASFQLASIVARAPIPKDVRSGEFAADKIEAYCSRMEEVSVPLATKGMEAVDACSKFPATTGWYGELCATATASAPSP